MSIDSSREEVITLTKAARRLPARRAGKRPHVSCLYRWTTTGCRGVVLESIQIGGTRCTSAEAMERFFQRLGESSGTSEPTQSRSKCAKSRARDAEKRLDAAGI